MWGFLKKVVSRVGRRAVVVTLSADDEGVVIGWSDREGTYSFRWDDVEEILTFKRDLWTVDSIRLAFRVGDRWYEVGEEDAGFMSLVERMQAKFPAVPEAWYLEVMFPAFEANSRVLWEREKPSAAVPGGGG